MKRWGQAPRVRPSKRPARAFKSHVADPLQYLFGPRHFALPRRVAAAHERHDVLDYRRQAAQWPRECSNQREMIRSGINPERYGYARRAQLLRELLRVALRVDDRNRIQLNKSAMTDMRSRTRPDTALVPALLQGAQEPLYEPVEDIPDE